MLRSVFLALAAVVLLAAAPTVSRAQAIDFSAGLPTQLWTLDTVGDAASGEDAVEARLRGLAASNSVAVPDRASEAELVARLSSLSHFQISAARRQANTRAFLDQVRRQDPSGLANWETFLSQDVFVVADQAFAEYGMSTNNVADAFTFWWLSAWEASHGAVDAGRTDARTMAAIRRQSLGTLLATPGFIEKSDAEKQAMADEYILHALGMAVTLQYMADHRDQLPAYSRAVTQNIRAQGMDMQSMTLTPNGFDAR